jgi:hypothetical protein
MWPRAVTRAGGSRLLASRRQGIAAADTGEPGREELPDSSGRREPAQGGPRLALGARRQRGGRGAGVDAARGPCCGARAHAGLELVRLGSRRQRRTPAAPWREGSPRPASRLHALEHELPTNRRVLAFGRRQQPARSRGVARPAQWAMGAESEKANRTGRTGHRRRRHGHCLRCSSHHQCAAPDGDAVRRFQRFNPALWDGKKRFLSGYAIRS